MFVYVAYLVLAGILTILCLLAPHHYVWRPEWQSLFIVVNLHILLYITFELVSVLVKHYGTF